MALAFAVLACSDASASSPPADAVRPSLHVEYRTSRVLGLVMFATTIADFPNRPGALRDAFRESGLDTNRARATIIEWRGLHQYLMNGIDAPVAAGGRPSGPRRLEQILLWRALEARDLGELRRSTQGLLPVSQEDRYFALLADIAEIYDPLVWEPSRTKLETYRSTLEAKTAQWGGDDLFARAAVFYRARWPADLPFTVALYPIPGARGSTTAESLGSLEVVAVLIDEEDIAGRFAVIFHEICHSLYDAEPPEVQAEIEGWFAEDPSPSAALAHAMFNEGMATAIGNGAAFERATGHTDGDAWYADDAIDRYGRALYPSVRSALATGGVLDRAMVQGAIETFRKTFPDAPYRTRFLFREIVLLADGETLEPGGVIDALRSRLAVSSIHSSAPIDGEEAAAYLRGKSSTVLIAVSPGQVRQLAGIEGSFPALGPRLERLRETISAEKAAGLRSADRMIAGYQDGRAVFVVLVQDRQGLDRAAAKLAKLDRIPPDGADWTLEE